MGFIIFIMDNEIYDGIEWEIDDMPSMLSSGDEPNTWIHEFGAKGYDDNGNEIHGTAHYTENDFGFFFDYVEYDEVWQEEDDEDYEEDEEC